MSSPPWAGVFEVDGEPDAHIPLKQVGRRLFELGASVTYVGEVTGLEGEVDADVIDAVRTVTPDQLAPSTDLASVPGPLRWFVNRYGPHTPAALIHDRLIGVAPVVEGLTDQHADRYFRFMLKAVGVRFVRRWVMWAAVALRTRWCSTGWKRASLVVWLLASLAGLVLTVLGAVNGWWAVVAGAVLAPFLFALLWGKQYGAGIVAAYAAPWIGPPTALAMVGYLVYLVLETVAGWITSGPTQGAEVPTYENF